MACTCACHLCAGTGARRTITFHCSTEVQRRIRGQSILQRSPRRLCYLRTSTHAKLTSFVFGLTEQTASLRPRRAPAYKVLVWPPPRNPVLRPAVVDGRLWCSSSWAWGALRQCACGGAMRLSVRSGSIIGSAGSMMTDTQATERVPSSPSPKMTTWMMMPHCQAQLSGRGRSTGMMATRSTFESEVTVWRAVNVCNTESSEE
mmetsp:Transcript_18608/g.55619  ORF Transcript_18608/g.55619 Transcript_18608/m.55619 type:complete len:203 (-) Transcript_18608:408-1016(-)